MAQKKHWNGLEDLARTPEQMKSVEKEFEEELPVINYDSKFWNSATPRRDFLKYLGFSTLAATVAASCEMPVRHAIPFAIKPENITPGVPLYYASSFVDNGEYCAVLVKTRDGRPIMVEGNKNSPITKGRSTARSVASTLSLYDSARLRQPHVNGKAADSFKKVDEPIAAALAAGGTAYLVTGTVMSPTTQDIINKFIAKYPNVKHVQYDPVSYSGMLLANEMSYGKRALPSYHFDKAETIFSIGADFLGTWLSPAEFTMGYTQNRKVTAKNPVMSKHYQVESLMSITGAAADDRATCKPSEYGKVAAALYNAIVSGTAPNFSSKKLNTMITKAAASLKNNGLVVCGSNDVQTQVIVNAINAAIGANGNTVNWAIQSNYKKGNDADMAAMVDAMNAGSVSTILFHQVNPVYDYFDAEKFMAGLKKVKTTVSFNDRMDETTQACAYAVPDHHWLESWGDVEPKTGYFGFIQPTIAPLFKTRAFQDSLLKWMGETGSYYDYFNQYWVGKLGQENFDLSLQDGLYNPAEYSFGSSAFSGDVNAAIAAVNGVKSSEYEVLVYESIALGAGGAWSNNPWLMEMPDPISKITWDNYAAMSPKTAKAFNAEYDGYNQEDRKRRVVKVKVGKTEMTLPVAVIPGMNNNTIAIALGYGRSKEVGMAANNIGKNAYLFTGFNGQTRNFYGAAAIETTSEKYPLASTQTHLNYEGRSIIHEYTLEDFKKNPRHLIEERKKELGHYTALAWEEGHDEKHDADADFDEEGFEKHGTLYPVHEKPGIHWGMSIDLNACTGCAACVIACQAENNVSVVGKKQVLQSHDMAWIRIDRYFSGDPDDPDTVQAIFQPMLCQHCDNAPCENVCPVNATNHSSEGLNQMVYNRCIGTKYCANNCPYKVRRFNWFDWNGADSFDNNLYEDGVRDSINNDLERMVLNPDVTVRSRGVMEKCTFCVQRLQDAKLEAKKAGRPLQDGEAKTACQVACASDAIQFGNFNDKESQVYKIRKEDNKERIFYSLEHLHTLPNINYLSRIRNTDEVLAGGDKDEIYKQHL